MNLRGKLIAMEGIDGAGKRTQIALLERALRRAGVRVERISFPRYGSFFGRLVGRYLNGEFGSLADVDAHLSAVLYAGDRLESRPWLEIALRAGKLVLADRYIASNLAHQAARVPSTKRAGFLRWLAELEYGVFRLPREHRVIYLRVPARAAQRLVMKKSARSYTRRKKDLQEASRKHLEEASKVYDRLARQENWTTIECFDARRRVMKTPDQIHKDIVRKLKG